LNIGGYLNLALKVGFAVTWTTKKKPFKLMITMPGEVFNWAMVLDWWARRSDSQIILVLQIVRGWLWGPALKKRELKALHKEFLTDTMPYMDAKIQSHCHPCCCPFCKGVGLKE
jgi:hypothetical protein